MDEDALLEEMLASLQAEHQADVARLQRKHASALHDVTSRLEAECAAVADAHRRATTAAEQEADAWRQRYTEAMKAKEREAATLAATLIARQKAEASNAQHQEIIAQAMAMAAAAVAAPAESNDRTASTAPSSSSDDTADLTPIRETSEHSADSPNKMAGKNEPDVVEVTLSSPSPKRPIAAQQSPSAHDDMIAETIAAASRATSAAVAALCRVRSRSDRTSRTVDAMSPSEAGSVFFTTSSVVSPKRPVATGVVLSPRCAQNTNSSETRDSESLTRPSKEAIAALVAESPFASRRAERQRLLSLSPRSLLGDLSPMSPPHKVLSKRDMVDLAVQTDDFVQLVVPPIHHGACSGEDNVDKHGDDAVASETGYDEAKTRLAVKRSSLTPGPVEDLDFQALVAANHRAYVAARHRSAETDAKEHEERVRIVRQRLAGLGPDSAASFAQQRPATASVLSSLTRWFRGDVAENQDNPERESAPENENAEPLPEHQDPTAGLPTSPTNATATDPTRVDGGEATEPTDGDGRDGADGGTSEPDVPETQNDRSNDGRDTEMALLTKRVEAMAAQRRTDAALIAAMHHRLEDVAGQCDDWRDTANALRAEAVVAARNAERVDGLVSHAEYVKNVIFQFAAARHDPSVQAEMLPVLNDALRFSEEEAEALQEVFADNGSLMGFF